MSEEELEDFKPGLPECLDMVDVKFERKDVEERNKHRRGRPTGALNKKTTRGKVFRKQMEEHFEKVMRKDFQYVLRSTVELAKDGDMQATKMLMDRVIPVGKAIDLADNKGTPLININIGSLEKPEDDTEIVSEQ